MRPTLTDEAVAEIEQAITTLGVTFELFGAYGHEYIRIARLGRQWEQERAAAEAANIQPQNNED